jgi:hypothetical protein
MEAKDLLKHVKVEVSLDLEGLSSDLWKALDAKAGEFIASTENKIDDGIYAVASPVLGAELQKVAAGLQADLDSKLAELQAKLRGDEPAEEAAAE